MTPHYSTGTEKVLSNSIAGSISSNLSKKYSPDTKMSDVKDSDMRDAITSTAQTYGVDPNSALKSYDVIKDNGGSNTDALFGSVSTMTTQAKNKISPEQQAYFNNNYNDANILGQLKQLNNIEEPNQKNDESGGR